MKELTKFYEKCIQEKIYWIPLCLFTILSYGFSIANRTVGIDDLDRAFLYFKDSGTIFSRWGFLLYIKLFSTPDYFPFIDKFVATFFMVMASILLAYLVYVFDKSEKSCVLKYTIISSVFVSYPLINEIWEYNATNISNGINYCLIIIATIIIFKNDNWNIKRIIICGLILGLVMASYEAHGFAYVSLVIMVLFMQAKNEEYKLARLLKKGCIAAVTLFLALVVKFGIGAILATCFSSAYKMTGDAHIIWFSAEVSQIMSYMFKNVKMYFAQMLVYYPIAVFVGAVVVFFTYIFIRGLGEPGRRINIFIFGMLELVSLFSLSILSGSYMEYRTAAGLQLFVAFVAYFVADFFERSKYKMFVYALLLFLAFRQSVYLNSLLSLNNQRSENEARIASEIGYRLYSEYDTEKKVIFVGQVSLGEWIDSKIVDAYQPTWELKKLLKKKTGMNTVPKPFVITNVRSCLDWNTRAMGSQIMMKKYMSYYGYDIDVYETMGEKERAKYNKIAADEEMQTYEIRDMGEYILVNLGTFR